MWNLKEAEGKSRTRGASATSGLAAGMSLQEKRTNGMVYPRNSRQCVALCAYHEKDDSKGVSIISHGKDAVLKSLEAWQMKNIYK